MKKSFILIFYLLFTTLCVNGQNVVVDVSGGYCLPIARTMRAETTREVETATLPYYYIAYQKSKAISFGQGGNIAFNVCWYSKKNIGIGLRLNALFSSYFAYALEINNLDGSTTNVNFTAKPFSFQFMPYLALKYDFKKVSPFVELGMVIGATRITNDYVAHNSNSAYTINGSQIDNGSALLGFHSRIGLYVNISKKVKFITAFESNVASYSPSQWTITKYQINGQNYLQQLSATNPIHGTFSNESSITNTSPNKSKYSAPYSSIGLSVGFAFFITKKIIDIKKREEKVVHPF